MSKKLVGVVGLIIIATFVAFTFPSIVNSAPETTEETVTLEAGESDIITEYLRIQADDPSNTDVVVIATNTRTGDLANETIDLGTTAQFILDGDTVNITNQASDNSQATLTVEYSRSFGWSDQSDWFINNIGLLMVIIAFVAIMAGLLVVVR